MSADADGPLFFTGDDALSVASDLLNTVDLLARPADRLTRPEHLAALLDGHGYPADPVAATDVDLVRRFREQLRAVWQAGELTVAVERLDALLGRYRPSPRLLLGEGGVAVTYGDRAHPARALVDDTLGALAHELAEQGIARLGTCVGDPCRCVFVDRSRNRARRYCCQICTDRAASAAYRQRVRARRTSSR